MIRSTDEIEKILAITDKEVRLRKLTDAAAQLGSLESLIKRYNGQHDEQQLVVAVYDGLVAREQDVRRNKRFIFFSMIGFFAAVVVVTFIPRAVVAYIRLMHARHENRSRTYKGLDEKGKVVKDEQGQPVLFREMDGYYDQYYDEGMIQFEYRYADGKIVEQKEYDRKGRLIAHFIYDEKGAPQLIQTK